MLCKICNEEILEDGYNYDTCISCYAKIINCEIRLV